MPKIKRARYKRKIVAKQSLLIGKCMKLKGHFFLIYRFIVLSQWNLEKTKGQGTVRYNKFSLHRGSFPYILLLLE